MAVPPNLVGDVEAAGLAAMAYGMDSQALIDTHRDFWTSLFRNFWNIPEVRRLWREVWNPGIQSWQEMSKALTSLTDGADLLLSGISFQEGAANIAEYYGIPLVTLHTFPIRANGYLVPILPAPLGRRAITALEWLHWRMTRKVEDEQRRELGLPKAKGPHRGASPNAERWKSRLTTRCAFRNCLRNGRNSTVNDRLSER
ncbi:glycosyltransferase family 28 N-terminal domain protein [Mycobacterium xenopi 3993]|nr:glycosyltransferase family 28 N-terminal domain protein [Mycobacterium xenopi 3993]